jgi:spermidine/putrescine-binding protein
MTTRRDSLNVLAPTTAKPGLDLVHSEVQAGAGRRINRRDALGMAGLALLATACGTGTGASSGSSPSAPGLAGDPLENHLEVFNWSQYDDPSTYTKFKALPAEAKVNLTIHETYYSSNDELLAKLNAGAGSYDIIVPTQNAVAQLIQEGKLLKLDKTLLPNLKNLDPSFLTPPYDPGADYHVIKDFGITMFFYNSKVVSERPQTTLDFYHLLPKYVHRGRTNILDGANEVVPNALMALDLDPNTDKASDFSTVSNFLLSIRHGVTTINSSSYVNDAIAGKIILGQGWSGDIRRIVQGRKAHGDITGVIPHNVSENLGRQLVHPRKRITPGRRSCLDQLAVYAQHRGHRDAVPQLQNSDAGRARPAPGQPEKRSALQHSEVLHRQLQVHTRSESARRPDAHADLRAVRRGVVLPTANPITSRFARRASASSLPR